MKTIGFDTSVFLQDFPNQYEIISNNYRYPRVVIYPSNIEEFLKNIFYEKKDRIKVNASKNRMKFINDNKIELICGNWILMLAYEIKKTIESQKNYIHNLKAYKAVIGEYNNPQFSDFIDKTIESRISSRYDISFVYQYHKTKIDYYISKTKVLEETLFEDIHEKIDSELIDYLLKEFADYKRELRKFKKKPILKKAKYIKKLHSECKNPDRKTKEYFLEFKNNIKKYRHYLIFDAAVSMMESTNNVALNKDNNYAYLPLIYMMHLAFSSLIESRKAKELDINSIVDVELLCYATMMGTDYFVTSDKVLFKDGSWVLRNILDRKKPVILYFDKDNKKGYLEIIHLTDITLPNNGVRVLDC